MFDSFTGIIIVVGIGLVLFGAKKVPELFRTAGKAKGEFKKGEMEAQKEIDELKAKLDNATKIEDKKVA